MIITSTIKIWDESPYLIKPSNKDVGFAFQIWLKNKNILHIEYERNTIRIGTEVTNIMY